MELENILSEVTQTQKDKYLMYSLISGFKRKTTTTTTKQHRNHNSRELGHKKDPKRDIHGSSLHGR